MGTGTVKEIVVQKYGGTSVGSPERILKIARRVARLAPSHRLAVVCSAMSGETNRITELFREIAPEARGKHYDMAVSAGEQVTVGLMAAAIVQAGGKAEPLLAHQLGIRTDNQYSRARIEHIETENLHRLWDKGIVPVIAGFQGMSRFRTLTTLGRGGSDTSAVALAVALDANLCEINTDVDGVYTADPRSVPNAKLIPKLDYETALELSSLGSKVLHIRCVELAAKYRMPLVVRNSMEENERSTRIMDMNQIPMEAPLVAGVTVDANVSRIQVENLSGSPRVLSAIFDSVAKAGANVDVIVHDRKEGSLSIGFTVGVDDADKAVQALEGLKKKGVEGFENMTTKTETDVAKVSAVGFGMRSHAGVAATAFRVLDEARIPIRMISTSEIKISCVIPRSDGERAAQILHACFLEGPHFSAV